MFYVSVAPEGSFRNMQATFFDMDGKVSPFTRKDHDPIKGKIRLPKKIKEMEKIARDLSADFDFVRVDLFCINEKIYFLELTFSPCSDFMPFSLDHYDLYFGNKLKIRSLGGNTYGNE